MTGFPLASPVPSWKESPQARSDGLEYVSQPDESGIESIGSEHPWPADTERNNVFLPDSS
jgi:hypothetical protein